MQYPKNLWKYLRKSTINHFMSHRPMRSGLKTSNSWYLDNSRGIKGNRISKRPIFYNKTAIEGKMDLPRNRLPQARPDARPNDVTIVRLLRLQTSIFQRRFEKIDKNIQNITEKKFSEESEKRRVAVFSMTTNQKQGKYPLCMPKTQTIFIHHEVLWCFGFIFTLCSVLIIILRAL